MQKKKSKLDKIHGGEIVAVNDKNTKGHGGIMLKPTKKDRRKDVAKHIPITHSPTTRRMKNIRLQQNPQAGKVEASYILPKVQKAKADKLGKRKKDVVVKNTTDKSVVRHLKKENKKRR